MFLWLIGGFVGLAFSLAALAPKFIDALPDPDWGNSSRCGAPLDKHGRHA